MELEGVGAVAVRLGALEGLGEVDDVDGLEWALLHADAAADAELLRDEGDLGDGGLG